MLLMMLSKSFDNNNCMSKFLMQTMLALEVNNACMRMWFFMQNDVLIFLLENLKQEIIYV